MTAHPNKPPTCGIGEGTDNHGGARNVPSSAPSKTKTAPPCVASEPEVRADDDIDEAIAVHVAEGNGATECDRTGFGCGERLARGQRETGG